MDGKASDQGIWWAHTEYFDILWLIDEHSADITMYNFACRFDDTDNWQMIGRLGLTFLYGRGVVENHTKAYELLEKASNHNVGWAKNEIKAMGDFKGRKC